MSKLLIKNSKYFCLGMASISALAIFVSTGTSVYAGEIYTQESSMQKNSMDDNYSDIVERVANELSLNNFTATNLNDVNDLSKSDKYTLTPEDEKRIDLAVSKYVEYFEENNNAQVQYRGLGKHQYNSRGFVAGAIDVGLIAFGIGASAKSAQAISALIKANRKNITRAVEKSIMKHVGVNVSSLLGAALDIAGTISNVSVGGAIAYGLDKVDGKLDGYIFA